MDTVNVLLSTFNGEKYLEAQVDSIMAQKNVSAYITLRDDGSKDSTLSLAYKLAERYPGKIKIIEGKNVGYRKSFLTLFDLAEPADYYGFADQDDVWLPDKCAVAVEKLKAIDTPIALYASSVSVADEKLDVIGINNISTMHNTLQSYFARARLAGCTFVFTSQLKEMAQLFSNMDYPPSSMPDHDFVVGSCAFACGMVFLDANSYLLHRRHQGSVTSGGNGLIKRIRTEFDVVTKRKNVCPVMAQELIEKCNGRLGSDAIGFLKEVVEYRQNLLKKMKLLADKKLTSGIWICDAETKLRILLGNF